MNNQEILDNAPEGATHIDFNNHYWHNSSAGYWLICGDGSRDCENMIGNHIRKISDIQALVDKNKRIAELEKQNAELRKERDELNKQCGEFQEGFFEYMGWCDHLQIEVDNLKKKVVNLTTPDTSEKLGVDS